jgi:ATP-binding cassette subfamily C protein CydC
VSRLISPVAAMVAAQRRAQSLRLFVAAVAGAVVSAAAVALLGLSGWFITGAAMAGAAGSAAAHAFNYMLPSAFIRLLAIVRTGSRYVERVAGHEAALKALGAMRPQLFRALAAGAPDRVLGLAAGEASSRLVEDVETIQTLFVRLSSPWSLGAGAVMAAGMAALAGPMAAVVILIGMGASAVLAVRIGRRVAPAAREAQEAAGDYKARLAALAASTAELRAYGLTDWAMGEAAEAGDRLDRLRSEAARRGAVSVVWQAVTTGVTVAMVVVAARDAHPALVALAALAAVTGIEAAAGMVNALRDNGAAEGAVVRLDALAKPDQARPTITGTLSPVLQTGLFGKTATPSQRIGLIGPSGCGKTSLIERLLGLRSQKPGEWLVGGQDAARLPLADLRGLFAYSAQDVRLIDGSVRENLRLAAPDASDAEMWAALDDAGLSCRVRVSPKGLNMPVGPNGARLSGGERRRLSLARAYLRDAPWLVLDEPTEGLDGPMEAQVLERLERRLARTAQGLILVSHRPGPLALCEQVHGVGERRRARRGETV